LNLPAQAQEEEAVQVVGEPIAANGLGQIDLNAPISMQVESFDQVHERTGDEVDQDIVMEEEPAMPAPAALMQPVNFLHLKIEQDVFEGILISSATGSNIEVLGPIEALGQSGMLEGAASNSENVESSSHGKEFQSC
jgi:hypothetical protein